MTLLQSAAINTASSKITQGAQDAARRCTPNKRGQTCRHCLRRPGFKHTCVACGQWFCPVCVRWHPLCHCFQFQTPSEYAISQPGGKLCKKNPKTCSSRPSVIKPQTNQQLHRYKACVHLEHQTLDPTGKQHALLLQNATACVSKSSTAVCIQQINYDVYSTHVYRQHHPTRTSAGSVCISFRSAWAPTLHSSRILSRNLAAGVPL